MGFICFVGNFKWLGSYAAAKDYFERTKVIRGQDKDVVGVPIQVDRKHWKNYSLRKRGTDYMLRLYNTDVVTWHKNGDMTLDWSYGSRSTSNVVDYYAPDGVLVDAGGNTITVNWRFLTEKQKARAELEYKPQEPPELFTFIVGGKTTLVYSDKLQRLTLRDTPVTYRREYDRKKTGAVRKRAEDFMKFFKTFSAVSPPTAAKRYPGGGVDHEAATCFKNKDKWADLAMHFMYIARTDDAVYMNGSYKTETVGINTAAARQNIHEVLYRNHNGNLHKLTRVPFGYYTDQCVSKGETR